MSAVTLRQEEGLPSGYPPVLEDVEDFWAWDRVEAWCDRRWIERTVTWVVEGPGDWRPPLWPTGELTVSIWQDGAWEPFTAEPSPLGGLVLDDDTYQIVATVGDGSTIPFAVRQAVHRLAAYGKSQSSMGSAIRKEIGDVAIETTATAGARAARICAV
ncbi:MAG: hypothetical protein AAGF45_01810 [Pseudomonadota bacterium]